MVKRLALLEDILSEMTVNVITVWIPGHEGILFNEIADGLAKDTSGFYTRSLIPEVGRKVFFT